MTRHSQLLTGRSEHARAEPCPDSPEAPTAQAQYLTEPRRTLVVRVAGEVDAGTVGLVRDALDAYPAPRTVVDLSRVDFADCSLLNILLTARQANPLVLAGPLHHPLRRLFDLTATSTVFTFAPDLTTALALFPQQRRRGTAMSAGRPRRSARRPR